MKKILFAMPLFAMLLVACDPIVDEISPDPNVTPENLTFELVAKNRGKQQHSDCSYSVTLCEGL